MRNWTAEQRQAIDSRGENLLLAAGAGSGKTAVLTERIARMATGWTDDGEVEAVPLRSLLVVTFTRAAATEMRQRIQKRLEELARNDARENVRFHAREELQNFDQAQISTLHSFCQSVLRRHFTLPGLDLDPSFRMVDTAETALLRQTALEECIENAWKEAEENGQSHSVELLSSALSDGKSGIAGLVERCYLRMMSLPDPWGYLQGSVAVYGQTFEEFVAGDDYRQLLEEKQQLFADACDALFDVSRLAEQPQSNAKEKFLAALPDCLAQTQHAKEVLDAENIDAILALQSPKFPDFRSWPKAEDAAKSLLNCAKDAWKQIQGDALNPEPLYQAMHDIYEPLQSLSDLLKSFHAIYQQKKRDAGVLDFNDLEQMTLIALSDESVRNEYRSRYQGVFVDEYQDSNRVQEAIVSAISGEGQLFCVGDIKQSIYRFRAADPGLFRERESLYHDQPKMGKTIHLQKNFRSEPNVLFAVNDVFSRIMEPLGSLRYGEENALAPGRTQEGEAAPVRLTVCLKQKSKTTDEEEENEAEEEALTGIHQEATLAVQAIQERMKEEIRDAETGLMRKPCYRDFAVLLRTASGPAEEVAQIFSQAGIPAYAALRGGYFETLEIQVLLNLMRLVDNRRQDLALLSVMRAGFCGFTDDDLVALRLAYPREKSVADAYLLTLQSEATEPLFIHCRALDLLLHEAKQYARALALDKWILWLMEKTDYDLLCSAMPSGQQRKANLDLFLQRARDFEARAAGGLYGFLQYIDRLQEAGQDEGEAMLSGGGSDAVRIETIHGSKGLEYPIVLLLGLGRKINQQDTRSPLLLHVDLGMGARSISPHQRIRKTTLRRERIKQQVKEETIAEELRLLYVAMTRACEELWMFGSCSASDNKKASWLAEQATGSLLDFLLDAVIAFPQSASLRESLEMDAVFPQDSDALWQIETAESVFASQEEESSVAENALRQWEIQAAMVDPSSTAQHYAWQYNSSRVPGKVTVSSLASGRAHFDETPRFLAKSHQTGADYGMAYHAVLEHLDWQQKLDEPALFTQLEWMRDRDLISQEQRDMIDPARLSRFCQSELGQRVQQADQRHELHREWPFTAWLDAQRVTTDAPIGEKVILQGVIDACFWDSDAWVLIDYKSDRIVKNSPEALQAAADAHKDQLSLYAHALTELTGKPVKQTYIYLLSVGEAILVDAKAIVDVTEK